MSTKPVRILLVDDDIVDRMAFLRHAKKEALPYEFVQAASLAEARASLARDRFDVIVLDRQLPDGLGFELLPETGSTPVIFVTGSESPDQAVRAMKAGAVDYLLKDQERNYLRLMPLSVDRALLHRVAAEQLKDIQELMRQSFNEAPIGKAFVSPAGKFLKVNRALCEMFGQSEAEFLLRGFEFVFGREAGPDCMGRMFPMLGEVSRTQRSERRCRHGDGRALWVQLDIALVPDSRGLAPTYITQVQDITERKQAEENLEKANSELVEASRLAGMAEVATGVLHNVGNVLNSVNVASSLIVEGLKKSKAVNLPKVVQMLRENESDLAHFLTQDPKGKQVVEYLDQLARHLIREQEGATQEMEQLRRNVEHIKEIVKAQQSYSKVSGTPEKLVVADLVEDALRMNSVTRGNFQLVKELDGGLVITVEKHKVLQILVNLIRNAKQACEEGAGATKRLSVKVTRWDGCARIEVSDNGVGIAPENLIRVFAHGFTTKKEGHGFGLHNSALCAKELGGRLTAASDGAGKGATFTLELPLTPEQ